MLSSNPKNKTRLFSFETEKDAKEFYDLAKAHVYSAIVQHPLSPDGKGKRILNRVLVTSGTDSQLYDINLEHCLVAEAEKRGGFLVKTSE